MSALTVLAHQLLLVATEALDEVPAPEDVRPGWIAMGSFFLLAIATVLLWMNMRKQIRKIDFEEPSDRGDGGAEGAATAGAPEDSAAENGEPRR